MSWANLPITSNSSVDKFTGLMILIPHRDEQDYRQWKSWWDMKLVRPPGTAHLEARGVSLTTNRTYLVQEALKTAASHFLFLDDDVIAPDNLIESLIAMKVPIACGVYMAKKSKKDRTLAAWMKAPGGYSGISNVQPGRYVQVDVTGLGCVLIHRSVFERVSQPWFVWEPNSISEDFYFFEKVTAEINVKPLIDMNMKCLHIGLFTVNNEGEFDTLDA
jgi:hypothetical protein